MLDSHCGWRGSNPQRLGGISALPHHDPKSGACAIFATAATKKAEGGGFDPTRLTPGRFDGFKGRCGSHTTRRPPAFSFSRSCLVLRCSFSGASRTHRTTLSVVPDSIWDRSPGTYSGGPSLTARRQFHPEDSASVSAHLP